MTTTTINLLPMATRTDANLSNKAQMPTGVTGVEALVTCNSDYSSASQQITLTVSESPTRNGTYALQMRVVNNGGGVDKNGNPEFTCGVRTDVFANDWGQWWQGQVQTVGTFTFQLDLIVTS